jgi:hypothetical protein
MGNWSISGFLPEEPNTKKWILIKNNTIHDVVSKAPAGVFTIDTDGYIFPGLMDMHSHVKYNILPLWNLAKGQFLNRFEWRTAYPAFRESLSFNMKWVTGPATCAAVRWAELKAITGGATMLQGIGTDNQCAASYGLSNAEIPAEYGRREPVRAITDIVFPDQIRSIFIPKILPIMKSRNVSYDKAYELFLEQEGVTQWIKTFMATSPNYESGLKLLLAPNLTVRRGAGAAVGAMSSDVNVAKVIGDTEIVIKGKVSAIRRALLDEPFLLKDEQKVETQLLTMAKWITAYLKLGPGKPTESKAYSFLSKGGNLAIPSRVRRYIGMFEKPVRVSLRNYFKTTAKPVVFAHLGEGMRQERYNNTEFAYAREFGLLGKGLAIIHGVGLSKDDFRLAAAQHISIIWSPFSNLLLYGDTLDVKAALDAGVNVAMGADWTPTGSKHMLGELKLARNYLVANGIDISNRQLVMMATKNAARVLGMDDNMGQVAKGYQANLMIVAKKSGDPYKDLVNSEQADVKLVVLAGDPLYGDSKLITASSRHSGNSSDVQIVKPQGVTCGFEKAFRRLMPTKYDESVKKQVSDIVTPTGIKRFLMSGFKAYADKIKATDPRKASNLVTLDTMFDCEDPGYQKRLSGYQAEVAKNNRNKAQVRRDSKLKESFHPIHKDELVNDDDDANDDLLD